MDSKDLAQLAVTAVKQHIQEVITPLAKKLSDLEAKEPPKEVDQDAIRKSIKEEILKNLDEVIDQKLAAQQPIEVIKGIDGKDGKDGEPGKDGKDGADGKDGKDGNPGERGDKGEPGSQGEKGLDGKPGNDGRDGRDGLDAVDLEILPLINPEKIYQRNTYASHKGGLWKSFSNTEGMKGWECIIDGVSDIEVSHDGTKGFVISFTKSSGKVVKKEITLPVMIYKGVFKEGNDYSVGDTVTYGGSLFHCNSDTKEKPATGSKVWTLAAKHGRDGKNGEKGARGEMGPKGKDGRDLTQMSASGKKW